MKAFYKKYVLYFKQPSGTSRGVLKQKETWFLVIAENGNYGIGECGILRGLSIDDVPEYEEKLKWVCANIHLGKDILWLKLGTFPSIQFGLEQAFLSLASPDPFILFSSDFTKHESPISINGLIWMGDTEFMLRQIKNKLEGGFRCIKMKIGAIDFDEELSILASIRSKFPADEIEIRVDANGAFDPDTALEKLQRLAHFNIHSIEQPLQQGNWLEMRELCKESPFPIALDEELIGITDVTRKEELLQTIQPHYIILKPSFVGGFQGSQQWIDLAVKQGIGWWITSALESNIGLNALAQWTYTLNNPMPQGLGTGSLFTNNFDSPLSVEEGALRYRADGVWKTNLIESLCI